MQSSEVIKETELREDGYSDLTFAIIQKNFKKVKQLVEIGKNVNAIDNRGYYTSPLFYAIYYNEFEIVKYLISQGANIHYIRDGFDGFNALSMAVNHPCDFIIFEYLVSLGVNLKIIPKNGRDLFSLALYSIFYYSTKVYGHIYDNDFNYRINEILKKVRYLIELIPLDHNFSYIDIAIELTSSIRDKNLLNEDIKAGFDDILHIYDQKGLKLNISYLIYKINSIETADFFDIEYAKIRNIIQNLKNNEESFYLKPLLYSLKNLPNTPLGNKKKKAYKEMLNFILEQGADINIAKESQYYFIDHAIDELNQLDLESSFEEESNKILQEVKSYINHYFLDLRIGNDEKSSYFQKIIYYLGSLGDTKLDYKKKSFFKNFIKFLLEQGADINAIKESPYYIIHYIIDEFQRLNSEEDFDKDSIELKKELEYYINNYLLDLKIENNERGSFLHYLYNIIKNLTDKSVLTIKKKRALLDLLQYLLLKKANPNILNTGGYSFIYYYMNSNDQSLLNFLFEKTKINLNLSSPRGKSYLVHALENNRVDMAYFLIEKGINVNILDDDGKNSLYYALNLNNSDKFIEKLIDVGVKHPKKKYLLECLFKSVLLGNLKIFNFLLENATELDAYNDEGWTLLLYAVVNNRIEIVELLLKKGVDCNLANQQGFFKGWSPLMHASYKGLEPLVRLLLENKADTLKISEKEQTPLSLAKEKQYSNIVKLLEDKLNEKNN